jgi:hypothetical protein
MIVSEELRHRNTEQVKTSIRKVQKMSELYMNIHREPVCKASSARECAVCHGTANPKIAVFLPNAEVMICKACAHDLAESLSPKAEVIPVTKPARKATVEWRGRAVPFDQEQFKKTYIREALKLLLEQAVQQ